MSRRRARWLAAAVACAGALLALASSEGDSPVVDEVPHIAAGYSYLVHRDMRLNPEHPPLVKDLAALPLLAMPLDDRAIRRGPWRREPIDQWAVSDRFLYRRAWRGAADHLMQNQSRIWGHVAPIAAFSHCMIQCYRSTNFLFDAGDDHELRLGSYPSLDWFMRFINLLGLGLIGRLQRYKGGC